MSNDFEGFKIQVKEFCDACPTLNAGELDNMYTELSQSYLHLNEGIHGHSAAIAFLQPTQDHINRVVELSKD